MGTVDLLKQTLRERLGLEGRFSEEFSNLLSFVAAAGMARAAILEKEPDTQFYLAESRTSLSSEDRPASSYRFFAGKPRFKGKHDVHPDIRANEDIFIMKTTYNQPPEIGIIIGDSILREVKGKVSNKVSYIKQIVYEV